MKGCKRIRGSETELANHCTISPAHQVQLWMKRRGGELWASTMDGLKLARPVRVPGNQDVEGSLPRGGSLS